jgi:hypothetical protein
MNRRESALVRFALDFLKANLEDIQSEGMMDCYYPEVTEDEVEKLKEKLGVMFS